VYNIHKYSYTCSHTHTHTYTHTRTRTHTHTHTHTHRDTYTCLHTNMASDALVYLNGRSGKLMNNQQSGVMNRVGQNHTFIGIHGIFGRVITIHTVIYGVCIRFWPALLMDRRPSILKKIQSRLCADTHIHSHVHAHAHTHAGLPCHQDPLSLPYGAHGCLELEDHRGLNTAYYQPEVGNFD